MATKYIIVIACCILYALMFILIPVKKSSMSKKLGKLVLPVTSPGLIKTIIILIASIALIVVSAVRNFAPWIQLVFCGCAFLAEYMSITDIANYGKNGVYENGFLQNGRFYAFSDIKSFPVLQLPESEQEGYSKNILVITTGKRGKEAVMFASDSECALVTDKIFELHPELKNW